MELSKTKWERLRRLFGSVSHAKASPIPNMPQCFFATVDRDGAPRVAPYSSLILGEHWNGFFFDQFSRCTSENFDRNQRVCALLLNNGKWFWFKSLLLGRYDHAPGIRLFGAVGAKRQATETELNTFRKPLRLLKPFKGYEPMWEVMRVGREVAFDSYEPVQCGPIRYVEEL